MHDAATKRTIGDVKWAIKNGGVAAAMCGPPVGDLVQKARRPTPFLVYTSNRLSSISIRVSPMIASFALTATTTAS
jgi:hypothetical protein